MTTRRGSASGLRARSPIWSGKSSASTVFRSQYWHRSIDITWVLAWQPAVLCSRCQSVNQSVTHSPSPLCFLDPHAPFATFTHLSRFCDATVVVVVVVLDTVVVTLAGADDVLLLHVRAAVVVLVVVVVALARARVLKRVVVEAPLHLARLPETTQV